MSRPTVPTCDECGAQKKQTNHWFVLLRANFIDPGRVSGVIVAHAEMEASLSQIGKDSDTMFDLCSEQCVTRAVGKWMRGELK